MPKRYLSNLSDHWPIERQRALLGAGDHDYEDVLTKAALTRVRETDKPEVRHKALKDRAALLAPSARTASETVEVASFLCLAVNTADFLDVVARAAGKNITLLAKDTGRRISPGQGTEELAREIPFFQAALRQRHLRSQAEYAAAIEEEARKRAQAPEVRALYERPDDEVPLLQVRIAAGKDGKPMAPATLRKHLGKRKDAQRLYQAGLKRSATAAAKRGNTE